MSQKPQTYANHIRLHPPVHYFVFPVFLVNVVVAIVHEVRHPGWLSGWLVVVSIALFMAVGFMRAYALKMQDRVIRLEERMRLARFLPEAQRASIGELSVKQLVALRFASDAELPGLAERAWKEKLTQKQIKQAIQQWRPDTFRV
ncbi:MAG TPA: DUF6526 family protein [Acidobacteriaceae bacterium]|nr:DUF6526 family protein [Acidobacteriaceae bacterium]